jgi:hypothetical protein
MVRVVYCGMNSLGRGDGAGRRAQGERRRAKGAGLRTQGAGQACQPELCVVQKKLSLISLQGEGGSGGKPLGKKALALSDP